MERRGMGPGERPQPGGTIHDADFYYSTTLSSARLLSSAVRRVGAAKILQIHGSPARGLSTIARIETEVNLACHATLAFPFWLVAPMYKSNDVVKSRCVLI